ncbi:MAG: class I SAM-dependent methyltransferase [Phycisphaerae bacterium]|nr:class I SAM-dependent methyltransferase [Phycisphaerae bacterium]
MTWQEDYLRRYYHSREDFKDGTSEYWELIRSNVPPSSEVLELGCGPDNPTTRFLAETFQAVDGLDIDEDGCKRNPSLREAYVYDGVTWPTADDRYDAIVSDYVLEHVEHPDALVREIRRVLKPGGVFVFRTPCLWHYVSLISRLTPHSLHERLANRLRNLSDEAEEPYPTFYRMNSPRTLRGLFAREGFERRALRSIEKEPYYGLSMKPLFLLFLLYERIVNSAEEFACLRSNILGVFRKPE